MLDRVVVSRRRSGQMRSVRPVSQCRILWCYPSGGAGRFADEAETRHLCSGERQLKDWMLTTRAKKNVAVVLL